MSSLFRNKRSSLDASPVDSIWAANLDDVEKLRSAMSRHASSNARADERGWIALVGGRNFGCRQIEAVHGYQDQFNILPAHLARVLEGLDQLKANDITLLSRMIQRKTPTPASRVMELAGSEQSARRLVASGLAMSDTNRKQERVYAVHADLIPAIRFEIDRRSYVWELACRYMQIRHSIASQLAQYRSSADVLAGYQTLAAPDSCAVCQQLAGKRHTITEPAPIPHPGCTHPWGCRCAIVPVVKDF
jgi:hypothetical protein